MSDWMWCYENPKEAAAELTRLTARVAELEAKLSESYASHRTYAAEMRDSMDHLMTRAEAAERERDEARREIERLLGRVNSVDDFLVRKGLWDEYVDQFRKLAFAAITPQEGGNG
jgi:seryl-tRNA synthetase